MVAALFGDYPVNINTIGGNEAADVVGGEKEDTLDTVQFLGAEGVTALALEEGIGSPGGTPKNTGGIVGGGQSYQSLTAKAGQYWYD